MNKKLFVWHFHARQLKKLDRLGADAKNFYENLSFWELFYNLPGVGSRISKIKQRWTLWDIGLYIMWFYAGCGKYLDILTYSNICVYKYLLNWYLYSFLYEYILILVCIILLIQIYLDICSYSFLKQVYLYHFSDTFFWSAHPDLMNGRSLIPILLSKICNHYYRQKI